MNKLIKAILIVAIGLVITGCNDAKTASKNLSKAADMFELDRRVIFYNGITGNYMLNIEGKCSIDDQQRQLEVTCKVGDNEYKKHFLGLSDNVTYFVEQLNAKNTSAYHYRVIFKPQSIMPDIDYRGNVDDAVKTLTSDAND